ncbi:hypothetical protein [Parasphingorhabdus sp.]|uniref:hypothetical protein n=1 Tax=Parasphingorhabdus sp. TaxID=2709688 RepID=UPI003592F593
MTAIRFVSTKVASCLPVRIGTRSRPKMSATFRSATHYPVMEQKRAPKRPDHSAAADRDMEGQEIESGKARGGEIILNKRSRRAIFAGGLVAWGLFMIIVALIGYG